MLAIKRRRGGPAEIYSDVSPNARGSLAAGVALLQRHTDEGGLIAGHNVIKFDIPAIQKLHPKFRPVQSCVLDTLVLARLVYADLSDIDARLVLKGKLPKKYLYAHSLAAWGHRLGNHKGDYDGGWESWNQDMEDYCIQDAEVTAALLDKLFSRCAGLAEPDEKNTLPRFGLESVILEHEVAFIIARQERRGFAFDEKEAIKLYTSLTAAKLELEEQLKIVFKPRWFKEPNAYMVPKRDNKKAGYTAGCPLTKVKLVQFNPSSRHHIAIWLKALYGWEPDEFTPDGSPKVDETVLAQLSYPEATLFRKYLVLVKRLGQLADGKEAWLRRVKNGRLHGSVITNGAVTGRMTHARPNMAQVPAGYSLYGPECRALFIPSAGYVLVGCDAEALELRDLAGYMAKYDNGAYVRVVLEGDKAKGTDIHSVNARALGLDPKGSYFDGESGRDIAKTWFYAFIYGAGDEKLGFILTRRKGPEARAAGGTSKKRFMTSLPALGKLVKIIQKSLKDRKGPKGKDAPYLTGLDGRILHIRASHAALNTLLQSAGAVQMKRALVILDKELQALGLVPGEHYEFVANVHDEWQIEALPEVAELVGKTAASAIRKAGESFGFRCPLAGAYEVGRSWKETH